MRCRNDPKRPRMTEAGNHLAIQELEVRRGRNTLIEGLRFSLSPGQRALIVGPNGTGKTSLLRILAGIAPVTRGEVRLDDVPSTGWGPAQLGRIAYRGHLDGLKLDLSGRENIAFYAALRNRPMPDRTVIERLRIGTVLDRPVRQLSAGQRRRVGFAVLKTLDAAVWMLDEPATNLDAEGRELISAWIDEHTAVGGIAIIATHLPENLTAPGAVLVEL